MNPSLHVPARAAIRLMLPLSAAIIVACTSELIAVPGGGNGQPPVSAVSVSLGASNLTPTQTTQASAITRDANNNVLSGRTIAWTSSDVNVATVTGAGVVTALAVGTAAIRATSEGIVGSAPIVVAATPPTPVASVIVTGATSAVQTGQSIQLTATMRDAAGNVLNGRAVAWTSGSTGTATVSSTGLVTGVAAGTVQITASSEGKSGSFAVTVTTAAPPPPPPVTAVSVTLSSASLTAGQTTQATATMRDANNTVLTGRVVTWSSSNTAVATVSGSGLVSAASAGTAQIRALSEGVTGAATLTVTAATPPAVATVTVSGSTTSLTVGGTTQLTATTRDANNTVLTGRVVTWSSTNTAVAAVSGTGLVTAIAAGSATIRATSETIVGSYAMTVTTAGTGPVTNECATPKSGWIWCDDFEQNRLSSYFEVSDASTGLSRAAAVGTNSSYGMRARYASVGQVGAGSLKLAFGRTPDPYMRAVDAGTANYREIYWRIYVRTQPGWVGGAGWKFTRGIVFAGSNWQEAAIGHVSGHFRNPQLDLHAESGTDVAGNLVTTTYNDFDNLRTAAYQDGTTPLFSTANSGKWYCVQAHMRLNDPGQSNATFEAWINGVLETRQTGFNWIGSYNAYGINALFIENYDNDGAPAIQERYFDNLVVSTQPIGC